MKIVARVLIAITVLLAAGCSKPEQEARKRFEFLKTNHASLGEVCDASREMVRAYSTAGDTSGYQMADIDSRSVCLTADMDGREQSYGRPVIQPDNLEMMPDNTTAPVDDIKTTTVTTPTAITRSEPPAAVEAKPAVAMCYKDYCPCEGLQGGPDTVLCDQLEQGIDPGVDLMIAGRGMREVRRQLASGDY